MARTYEIMGLPYHLSKEAIVIILYLSPMFALLFTSHPFQPMPSKPNESQTGIPKIEKRKNPNWSLLFALFVRYESLTEPLI